MMDVWTGWLVRFWWVSPGKPLLWTEARNSRSCDIDVCYFVLSAAVLVFGEVEQE